MTDETPKPTTRARIADALRGWGPTGILVFLVIMILSALFTPAAVVLVLLWVWASRTPWRDLGFVRPKSWMGLIALGIVLGIAEKFLMKAVVLPLLGAPPLNPVFQDLPGHPQQLALLLLISVFQAGFGEELLFRAYLFERIGKLIGDGVFQRIVMVLATTAIFAGLHFEQGSAGIENAAIVGGISATIYALTKRLWLIVVMHATFDIVSFLIIYYRLEIWVSHLVFHPTP